MVIGDLEVRIVKTTALRRRQTNPRKHSRKQIRQIAESIDTFGWTNPIITDDTGEVLAGHGRLEAALLLGLEEVPTIPLSSMTAAQKQAYVIADNKLALNAGWDDELLRMELRELLEIDVDFDIGVIGFETGEIDVLLAYDKEDEIEGALSEVSQEPPVSRIGDLYELGPHTLLCGDATKIVDLQ
jgi:ParB-like chromosome segregation protein Spo0J